MRHGWGSQPAELAGTTRMCALVCGMGPTYPHPLPPPMLRPGPVAFCEPRHRRGREWAGACRGAGLPQQHRHRWVRPQAHLLGKACTSGWVTSSSQLMRSFHVPPARRASPHRPALCLVSTGCFQRLRPHSRELCFVSPYPVHPSLRILSPIDPPNSRLLPAPAPLPPRAAAPHQRPLQRLLQDAHRLRHRRVLHRPRECAVRELPTARGASIPAPVAWCVLVHCPLRRLCIGACPLHVEALKGICRCIARLLAWQGALHALLRCL